jgi:hypothetical protein
MTSAPWVGPGLEGKTIMEWVFGFGAGLKTSAIDAMGLARTQEVYWACYGLAGGGAGRRYYGRCSWGVLCVACKHACK